MEFKELSYLLAIAEEKSISKAAERLYMSQSSLSESLSGMESRLGSKLFVRTSAGVRPTEAGLLMIQYANETLSEFHRVKDQIQDIKELKGGEVILGISSFRGSYLLPPVLNAFRMEYPYIHVKIVEAHSMNLEQLLLSGQIDIALLALPTVNPRISAEPIMKDEICLITSQNHPIVAKAYKTKTAGNIPLSIDIKYTTNYEFLLSGSDTILGKEARNLFRKYKITPVTYNESLTALFAAALAASGQGIAFTYYSSRHYFRNAAFLSLKKERNAIDLAVALSPGRYHSKAALALKEVMFKVLGY